MADANVSDPISSSMYRSRYRSQPSPSEAQAEVHVQVQEVRSGEQVHEQEQEQGAGKRSVAGTGSPGAGNWEQVQDWFLVLFLVPARAVPPLESCDLVIVLACVFAVPVPVPVSVFAPDVFS